MYDDHELKSHSPNFKVNEKVNEDDYHEHSQPVEPREILPGCPK